MKNEDLNTFYSSFKQWSVHFVQEGDINKVVPCLKRCVASLRERDESELLEVRDLNSDDILIEYCGDNVFVGSYDWFEENSSFSIGVKGPNWKREWRRVINNDELYDHVSWFFHFANQYVTRGRAIEVLGAISLTYDITFEYIGSARITQSAIEKGLEFSYPNSLNIEGYSDFKSWIETINGMDPFVQRALYFFSRYLSLREHGYFDEAITALDKVIDISHKFLFRNKVQPTRDNFAKHYSLNQSVQDWINQIYKVRSIFGGHPSSTKWWDSEELYGEWFNESSNVIKELLSAMFLFETQNRLIEKSPEKWSEWFSQNCMTVYNSVWFHKLPF